MTPRHGWEDGLSSGQAAERLRRDGCNPALWWLTGGALAALGLVLAVAPIREIFRFGTLDLAQLGWCAVSGLAGLPGYQLYKTGEARYPTRNRASR